MLACKPPSLWSCVTVAEDQKFLVVRGGSTGHSSWAQVVSRTVQAALIMCLWGQDHEAEGQEERNSCPGKLLLLRETLL